MKNRHRSILFLTSLGVGGLAALALAPPRVPLSLAVEQPAHPPPIERPERAGPPERVEHILDRPLGELSALAPAGPRRAPFRHGGRTTCSAVSASLGLVATGGWDGRVRFWEATTGRLVRDFSFTTKVDAVGECAFSADGTRFAATLGSIKRDALDETVDVLVVDLASGRVVQRLERPWVMQLQLSSDGRLLAALERPPRTHFANQAKVWDVATGSLVRSIESTQVHAEAQVAVAIHPSRDLLAVAADRSVRLYSIETGQVVGELSGYSGGRLFFSSSGDLILADGSKVFTTPTLWRLADGRRLPLPDETSHAFFWSDDELVLTPDTPFSARMLWWRVDDGPRPSAGRERVRPRREGVELPLGGLIDAGLIITRLPGRAPRVFHLPIGGDPVVDVELIEVGAFPPATQCEVEGSEPGGLEPVSEPR